MSIDRSGLEDTVQGGSINIEVSSDHPLLKLGKILPWSDLFSIILPDLQKSTSKGKWWLGRKLKVRIHLGVYVLQQLYNKKDRQIEAEIKENAVYQIFCGSLILKDFHCPDHTKIEEFRSRLSPKTHQILANRITEVAVSEGFAQETQMDIDSTVQEANMTHPRDVNLIVKLSAIAHKVGRYLKKTFIDDEFWTVDMKTIKSLARSYYFKAESSLLPLWNFAYGQVSRVRRVCDLIGKDLPKLPWFIKRALDQLREYSPQYFLDLMPWLLRNELCKTKALSFHLKEISCFNKNVKGLQFGRSFQLGRLQGNFLLVGYSDKVRMEDKPSLPLMVTLHQTLFGKGGLLSFAADKGYASEANQKVLIEAQVQERGLQRPGNKKADSFTEDTELQVKLANRRSGIEPLIGHLKRGWQMGKTRMKSDMTSHSSAYTSVFGFNIRQLMRYQALG